MSSSPTGDIGILDLEHYHLKHTTRHDTSAPHDQLIEKFLDDVQKQLFQFVVRDRKKVLIFKGIDPFVRYINKEGKSAFRAFAESENQQRRSRDSLLSLDFGDSSLVLEMERDPQYFYQKNLFMNVLESIHNLDGIKSEIKYLDESDLITNGKCRIFNNKVWNKNQETLGTKTISEEINLRIFYLIQEFMKPYLKNQNNKNEGFTQIVSFSKDEQTERGYDLTMPSFSDHVPSDSMVQSFHCLRINEFTTKLTCSETLSNNAFLHTLRSKSSSIPYLFPEVVPQDNHFVCFIDINDFAFDDSVTNVYSQVGYRDVNLTESSESVVKYDIFYNLRLWDKFNGFQKLGEIFDYYLSGLDLHRQALNDFVTKKMEKFIEEMDSWILLKFLNSKIKKDTKITIKMKDGFKFLSCKILNNIDPGIFYNFIAESNNSITFLLKTNSSSAYGNPRQKIATLRAGLALLLKQDVYFLYNLIEAVLSDIEWNEPTISQKKDESLTLAGKFQQAKLISPEKQSNRINKNISPEKQSNRINKHTSPSKTETAKRLTSIKKNIFKLDVMSKNDILDIVKQNEIKRELQKPTKEQIDRIFSLKLNEIVKIFRNYDVGNGIGIDVILSQARLYGILSDSNNVVSGVDLDEFEDLLASLVASNKLVKFEVGKEFFYRLK